MGKKTKLKNLQLTSVDLCQRGANPDADICLFKSAGADDDQQEDRIIKRIFELFKNTFTSSTAEGDKIITDAVEKDALTFGEIKTSQDTLDSLWKYFRAFEDSISSISRDNEIDSSAKAEMLETSLTQFSTAMRGLFPALAQTTAKSEPTATVKTATVVPDIISDKGESDDMIDKSKMTPEDLAAYENLCKKYQAEGTQGTEPTTEPATEPAPVVEKSAEVDPVLKSALDEVAELKKALEMQTLTAVAKKYEILGKKTDELASTLYELKKSGQANYDAYIAVLDESLALVEKSGVFGEVGKNTHSANGSDAVTRINDIAKSMREADPTLGYHASLVKACEENPELREEYEKGAY